MAPGAGQGAGPVFAWKAHVGSRWLRSRGTRTAVEAEVKGASGEGTGADVDAVARRHAVKLERKEQCAAYQSKHDASEVRMPPSLVSCAVPKTEGMTGTPKEVLKKWERQA